MPRLHQKVGILTGLADGVLEEPLLRRSPAASEER